MTNWSRENMDRNIFSSFTKLQSLEIADIISDVFPLPSTLTKLELINCSFTSAFYANLPSSLKKLSVSGDMPLPEKLNKRIPHLELSFNNLN